MKITTHMDIEALGQRLSTWVLEDDNGHHIEEVLCTKVNGKQHSFPFNLRSSRLNPQAYLTPYNPFDAFPVLQPGTYNKHTYCYLPEESNAPSPPAKSGYHHQNLIPSLK